jgi:hypothetical protein
MRTRRSWLTLVACLLFNHVARADHWDDFNRDILELRNVGTDSLLAISDTQYTWLVADVDGDHDDDLILRDNTGAANKILFSNGRTYAASSSTIRTISGGTSQPDGYVGANKLMNATWLVLDADHDGCQDLVRRTPTGSGNATFLSRYGRCMNDHDANTFLVVSHTDLTPAGASDPVGGVSKDGTQHTDDVHVLTDSGGSDPVQYTWIAGRFDDDELDDLIRVGGRTIQQEVLFSNGNGTFEHQTYTAPGMCNSSASGGSVRWLRGKFNYDDNKDDVACRTSSGTSTFILFSGYKRSANGTRCGTFRSTATDGYAGLFDGYWFSGDVDGNGSDDLARFAYSSTANFQRVFLSNFLCSGTDSCNASTACYGSFGVHSLKDKAQASVPYGGSGDQWLSGDFDGDSRLDFARRSMNGTQSAVLSRFNGTDDWYVTTKRGPTPQGQPDNLTTDDLNYTLSSQWLVADVNGDGYSDIIKRSSWAANPTTVLLNEAVVERPVFEPAVDGVYAGSPCPGGYYTFRIPSIAASGGTLVAIAEGRCDNSCDRYDTDIVMKRSNDGGATWSGFQVLCEHGEGACTNATSVVNAAGDIFLFMMVWETDRLNHTVYLTSSTDGGQSWTPPVGQPHLNEQVDQRLATLGVTGPGSGIRLGGGQMYVPATGRNFVSVDNGQNWTVELLGPLSNIQNNTGLTGEHTIGVLGNGDLVRIDRDLSNGYDYRMIAVRPYGSGWSSFVPNMGLPDAGVCGSTLPLVSEFTTRLLFMNAAIIGLKTSLLARVSYDSISSVGTWSRERWLFQDDQDLAGDPNDYPAGNARSEGTTPSVDVPGSYTSATRYTSWVRPGEVVRQDGHRIAMLAEVPSALPPTVTCPTDSHGYRLGIMMRRFNLAWILKGRSDGP